MESKPKFPEIFIFKHVAHELHVRYQPKFGMGNFGRILELFFSH
ncbi:MAG: hypothetical protein FD173_2335 [Gallionellaceae bacterium]|nr:MAG: hypothetical protein FD173_2335 [Gallionellaceae bacterium]